MKTLMLVGTAISLALAACSGNDASPTVTGSGDPPVCAIVTPATATLHTGDTLTVHVTGGPSCGAAYHWWWRSSNASIAAVDSVTGLVLAKSGGMTAIIATAVEVADVQGASGITVTP